MSSELGKPGVPRPTTISIDSVTIAWRAPDNGKASGYKVMYRAVDESDFIDYESHGTILTRCVRGLSHGIEYQFKVQAFNESGETAESDCCTVKTKEYYDIVMVGKTGQGKSTFGNKLLDLDNTPKSKIRLFEFNSMLSLPGSEEKRFLQANDPEVTKYGGDNSMLSVTARCKLLANDDTNIRVLDVPGFSDSGKLEAASGKKVSVKEGNLQIIRWVVRAQIQFQLKVRRIVYFLPVRGPLEKADGTFQDELRVLHHFFGKDIFDCMVVAATVHRKYQSVGFDTDDFETSRMVLGKAIESAIPENVADPPIMYIGMNDVSMECLTKIKGAAVARESILPLKFQEDTCARCSVKVRCNQEERISVVDSDGTVIPYAESKCHPCFIQKYNTLQKVAGGFAHILTLGIGLFVESVTDTDSWPGFTNSDEMCIECKKSPGALGCTPVHKKIVYKDGEIKVEVEHVNEL